MIHEHIKATREGEIGKPTASGYTIDYIVPFLALPSATACLPRRAVRLTNEANGKSGIGLVLDVGPVNTHDDAYVLGDARPQSETGTDTTGRLTNRAGIDLGEALWHAIGMTDNGPVSWEFLE